MSMACYSISTHSRSDGTQTPEYLDCADEASAFLAACTGLAPGDRRELRHGVRLVAVVVGARREAPKCGHADLWAPISQRWRLGKAIPTPGSQAPHGHHPDKSIRAGTLAMAWAETHADGLAHGQQTDPRA
jgi:hypothetical protein